MGFELETPRLWLRPWDPGDFDALKPIATDPEVMRFINRGEPWPDERIRLFIDRQIESFAERGYCRWKAVEKASGRVIGFCGPGVLTWMPDVVEIGWWMARDVWGKGFASEAAGVALQDALGRAGIERLISVAHEDNAASIRIMRKVGLVFERWAEHESGRHAVYRACAPPLAR